MAYKMILSSTALLLLVFLARGYAQEDCPDPAAGCSVDPCENQECLRFLNAACEPNLCFGGLCTANFFFRGKNVTDRCGNVSCETRVCKNRRCMETEVCLPSDSNCRRRSLKTRCILVPKERPMSCSDVMCGDDMACRMRDRGENFPPVVRCVDLDRLSNCRNIFCSEGSICRDDERPVRCVPMITTTATPPPPPPPPPVCSQEEIGECRGTGRLCTIGNDGSPTCDFAKTCEEVGTCPRGLECFQVSGIALCVPPSFICSQEDSAMCRRRGQTCMTREAGSRCEPTGLCRIKECPRGFECFDQLLSTQCIEANFTGGCDKLNCTRYDLICREKNGISRCLAPANCSELQPICSAGDTFTSCRETGGFPQCALPSTCDEIECDDPLICIKTSSDKFSTVHCLPPVAIVPLTCANFGEDLCIGGTCLDITQDGQIVSVFCTVLNCAEGACPSGTECKDVMLPDRPEIESACTPLDVPSLMIGVKCSEVVGVCEEKGMVCQEFQDKEMVFGSLCSFPSPVPLPGESCDDVQCTGPDEVCTETTAPSDPDYLLLKCVGIRF